MTTTVPVPEDGPEAAPRRKRRSKAAPTVAEAIAHHERHLLRLVIKLNEEMIYLEEESRFAEIARHEIEEIQKCIKSICRIRERLLSYPPEDKLTRLIRIRLSRIDNAMRQSRWRKLSTGKPPDHHHQPAAPAGGPSPTDPCELQSHPQH